MDFLSEPDHEQFVLKSVRAQIELGPQTLTDIHTLNGEVDVQAKRRAKQFCENFESFLNANTEINK